jgi:hypothetical protein
MCPTLTGVNKTRFAVAARANEAAEAIKPERADEIKNGSKNGRIVNHYFFRLKLNNNNIDLTVLRNTYFSTFFINLYEHSKHTVI